MEPPSTDARPGGAQRTLNTPRKDQLTEGKRPLAIVTGASTGIGRELARDAASRGYDLIIAADEPLEETAAELSPLGADVRRAAMPPRLHRSRGR